MRQKKQYPAEINLLRSVYDEKSYEINLRLGWLNFFAGNHKESKTYNTRPFSIMPYSVEAKM
jgi:hypothetical protein